MLIDILLLWKYLKQLKTISTISRYINWNHEQTFYRILSILEIFKLKWAVEVLYLIQDDIDNSSLMKYDKI